MYSLDLVAGTSSLSYTEFDMLLGSLDLHPVTVQAVLTEIVQVGQIVSFSPDGLLSTYDNTADQHGIVVHTDRHAATIFLSGQYHLQADDIMPGKYVVYSNDSLMWVNSITTGQTLVAVVSDRILTSIGGAMAFRINLSSLQASIDGLNSTAATLRTDVNNAQSTADENASNITNEIENRGAAVNAVTESLNTEIGRINSISDTVNALDPDALGFQEYRAGAYSTGASAKPQIGNLVTLDSAGRPINAYSDVNDGDVLGIVIAADDYDSGAVDAGGNPIMKTHFKIKTWGEYNHTEDIFDTQDYNTTLYLVAAPTSPDADTAKSLESQLTNQIPASGNVVGFEAYRVPDETGAYDVDIGARLLVIGGRMRYFTSP